MDTYSSMRIGFLAPSYPVPAVIQESGRIDWLIDKAHELGCSCLDRPRINDTPEERRRVRSLLEREGIEIECSARGVFDLASPESKRRGRSELEASITTASELGAGIIRTGYGKLTVATSRYSREIPIAEHLAFFTRCLVEAAEIMEGTGVPSVRDSSISATPFRSSPVNPPVPTVFTWSSRRGGRTSPTG